MHEMKAFGDYLVGSKLYIAFAAVLLTVCSQIQLGGAPAFHPYIFIVFFATLLEYNLTRFVVLVAYKMPLIQPSDVWVNNKPKLFYLTLFFAIVGLVIAVLNAKKIVLLYLAPMTLVTILYTLPFLKMKNLNLNLRQIPFLKIFLIMLVWSFSTVMLPILQLEIKINWYSTLLLLLERMLFIGSLAILFDLRDVEVDGRIGLKTLPRLLGEKKSLALAKGLLFSFLCVSFLYNSLNNTAYLTIAAIISVIILLYLMNNTRVKSSQYYHSHYLDGAILLYGFLIVLLFYYRH